MSEDYQPKTRVNAATLPNFNGQGVVIVGKVINVDPDGTSMQIESSDEKKVAIVFDQPVMENLEGVVEIQGTCHGSQIRCQSYFMHPVDQAVNFDLESYNEAVQLIHSTGYPFNAA